MCGLFPIRFLRISDAARISKYSEKNRRRDRLVFKVGQSDIEMNLSENNCAKELTHSLPKCPAEIGQSRG